MIARRRTAPVKVLEKDVRKAVRDWLDAKRIPHIPIEARRPIMVREGKMIFRNEQARDAGIADFIALEKPGPYTKPFILEHWAQPIAIECKGSNGKHSTAQREWKDWWLGLGFTYLLVRSVEDLEKLWPCAVAKKPLAGFKQTVALG